MQPYPDIPFKVSGLDPAVAEAWTRTRLCSGRRMIDVMHPDRLVNLRSLVRKKPLISRDDLVDEGNVLDRNEKRVIASRSIRSREVKHSANRAKEVVKEIHETIEILKKRVEGMDASDDEELEDPQDGDRVNLGTEAARVTRSSHLSGVRVGPSLSVKLNFILSEVCLHICINDMDYIMHACRSSDTL